MEEESISVVDHCLSVNPVWKSPFWVMLKTTDFSSVQGMVALPEQPLKKEDENILLVTHSPDVKAQAPYWFIGTPF